MPRAVRPCVECGEYPPSGERWPYGRCPACARARAKRRANDPERRRAYRDPAFLAISLVGECCALCGATDDLTRDHLVPLAYGGTAADGIRILCRSCNSQRGAGRLHDELVARTTAKRRQRRHRMLTHAHKARARVRAMHTTGCSDLPVFRRAAATRPAAARFRFSGRGRTSP